MNDATGDDDTSKLDFRYLILVVNVRNGKDLALAISLSYFESFCNGAAFEYERSWGWKSGR
jgi:hypothetical protein